MNARFCALGGATRVVMLDDVALHMIGDDHLHRATKATEGALVQLTPQR